MLLFLSILSLSGDKNVLHVTPGDVHGTRFLIPTSRIGMLKEAIQNFKIGKADVSIDGVDEALQKLSAIASLFKSEEQETNEVHGEVGIDAGWSQQQGAHIGIGAKITWAKQQQEEDTKTQDDAIDSGKLTRCKFTLKDKKGAKKDIHVSLAKLGKYLIILPHHTEHKFQHLEKMILDGKIRLQ